MCIIRSQVGDDNWKQPHANGQGKRYNRSFVTRHRNYINDHWQDWEMWGQPKTYPCNTQVQQTNNKLPFSLVLSRNPPGLLSLVGQQTLSEKFAVLLPSQSKKKMTGGLVQYLHKAKENASEARHSFKKYFDSRVQNPEWYNDGNWVFVKTHREFGKVKQKKGVKSTPRP